MCPAIIHFCKPCTKNNCVYSSNQNSSASQRSSAYSPVWSSPSHPASSPPTSTSKTHLAPAPPRGNNSLRASATATSTDTCKTQHPTRRPRRPRQQTGAGSTRRLCAGNLHVGCCHRRFTKRMALRKETYDKHVVSVILNFWGIRSSYGLIT